MSSAVPAIRPISDLRTDLNGVCEEAAALQEPIFMTKNGKPALVVIDCEAYARQKEHERIVRALREAEIEAKYNKKRISLDELNAHVAELLAKIESIDIE